MNFHKLLFGMFVVKAAEKQGSYFNSVGRIEKIKMGNIISLCAGGNTALERNNAKKNECMSE